MNNNATRVIVANTVDHDVQPLKKLNLFAGHTLADDVDILEPLAIVLFTTYYLIFNKVLFSTY